MITPFQNNINCTTLNYVCSNPSRQLTFGHKPLEGDTLEISHKKPAEPITPKERIGLLLGRPIVIQTDVNSDLEDLRHATKIPKIMIESDFSREEVLDAAKSSKVAKNLDKHTFNKYAKELYALTNLKNKKGDFAFSYLEVGDWYAGLFSKPDINFVKNILDIKYANPSSSHEVDKLLKQYKKSELSKKDLAIKMRLIENNLSSVPENLIHEPDEFFINIPGYGKNLKWAQEMSKMCILASLDILEGKDFKSVFENLAQELRQYSLTDFKDCQEVKKAVKMCEIRKKESCTYSEENGDKYSSYFNKYMDLMHDGKEPYEVKIPAEFPLIKPTNLQYSPMFDKLGMIHPINSYDTIIKYCSEIYNDLTKNYMGRKLDEKEIQEVNEKIGSMHWIIAHSVPFARGSDSVANAIVKSLYGALGFKLSPPKDGISFDLEAFCTEHKDYIKNYSKLYKNEPQYIL